MVRRDGSDETACVPVNATRIRFMFCILLERQERPKGIVGDTGGLCYGIKISMKYIYGVIPGSSLGSIKMWVWVVESLFYLFILWVAIQQFLKENQLKLLIRAFWRIISGIFWQQCLHNSDETIKKKILMAILKIRFEGFGKLILNDVI
jgi:hypothetical protein